MTRKTQLLRHFLSAAGLAAIQVSVLVAIVASQLGERAFRGASEFSRYRALLLE